MDKQVAIGRVGVAVSLLSFLLALGLAAFWIRSYFGVDTTFGPIGKMIVTVTSARGSVWLTTIPPTVVRDGKKVTPEDWTWTSVPNAEVRNLRAYGMDWHPNGLNVGVPHWVLIFATVLPVLVVNRFSLRTLLIATTLVAGMLGSGVWLANSPMAPVSSYFSPLNGCRGTKNLTSLFFGD